ncbi:uncharacterized protein PHALS_04560 [Plasmopara halstedii]|uniref:Uncharacterized protein n=1 Tax=Plasmopara halstedii TaxID=4781 RepID=A0A0P1AA57_PLAHL|nr:uncharacterized protein PHALS_04560 [Plasmopara halstedii]CEG37104.1 hypothetical protein PHALS_04560 [Plasmopara halstedii]|eukprot:XP_024573473.1 hypothetical protein PHALS_04560 [Plasmopara halstedii]
MPALVNDKKTHFSHLYEKARGGPKTLPYANETTTLHSGSTQTALYLRISLNSILNKLSVSASSPDVEMICKRRHRLQPSRRRLSCPCLPGCRRFKYILLKLV